MDPVRSLEHENPTGIFMLSVLQCEKGITVFLYG